MALYATFLNRAFDQVLFDCAMHRAGVTFALDRSGITGDDGASHNGMWDLSMLSFIPGIRVAAPRDAMRLREQLRQAVRVEDGPTVALPQRASCPTPSMPSTASAPRYRGRGRPYRSQVADAPAQVLLVGMGRSPPRQSTRGEARRRGLSVTVADPCWVLPVPEALVELARSADVVVTVEDNGRRSGRRSPLAQRLVDEGVAAQCVNLGIPPEFLAQGKRPAMLTEFGLTSDGIVHSVEAALRANEL